MSCLPPVPHPAHSTCSCLLLVTHWDAHAWRDWFRERRCLERSARLRTSCHDGCLSAYKAQEATAAAMAMPFQFRDVFVLHVHAVIGMPAVCCCQLSVPLILLSQACLEACLSQGLTHTQLQNITHTQRHICLPSSLLRIHNGMEATRIESPLLSHRQA